MGKSYWVSGWYTPFYYFIKCFIVEKFSFILLFRLLGIKIFFLCLSISLNCASMWNMKQHEDRGVCTLNQILPQISHILGSKIPIFNSLYFGGNNVFCLRAPVLINWYKIILLCWDFQVITTPCSCLLYLTAVVIAIFCK